jgi:hypothetical protein
MGKLAIKVLLGIIVGVLLAKCAIVGIEEPILG